MPRRLPAVAAAAALAVAIAILAYWLWPRPVPEPPEPRLALERVDFADLPGWTADRQDEALPALRRSCAVLARLPDDRPLGVAGTVADWRAPCAAAETAGADAAAVRAWFEAWFVPFAAGDGVGRDGLFTGYYEAALRGAQQPDERYRVPLLRRPEELVMVDLGAFADDLRGRRIAGHVVDGNLRPYPDRAAIAGGALAGRDLELLWVDDPVDAFFLEIQGSGRVELGNGEMLRVGYAGQNGHPYFAIGRELVARGALTPETVSMQSIRAWLAANPEEAEAVMNRNPSYVFFRILDGDGPIGAQGVVLTPGRSLAVDRSYVPLSVPVWLDGTMPGENGSEPLRRLLIAQDTGGAIRGPVRGDVFWGHGPDAEWVAGHMKHRGRYYLLLPRTVAERAG